MEGIAARNREAGRLSVGILGCVWGKDWIARFRVVTRHDVLRGLQMTRDRDLTCVVPAGNVARVGLLALAALAAACAGRGAGGGKQPRPQDSARPKLLWSVAGTGVSPASPFPLDAAGTVFLFDSSSTFRLPSV